MATGRYARTRYQGADYWPGFVDALATLLLVIVFLLSVFMVAQFYLRNALTGRDEALIRLEDQIAELSTLLALERQTADDIRGELTALTATSTTSTTRSKPIRPRRPFTFRWTCDSHRAFCANFHSPYRHM